MRKLWTAFFFRNLLASLCADLLSIYDLEPINFCVEREEQVKEVLDVRVII